MDVSIQSNLQGSPCEDCRLQILKRIFNSMRMTPVKKEVDDE